MNILEDTNLRFQASIHITASTGATIRAFFDECHYFKRTIFSDTPVFATFNGTTVEILDDVRIDHACVRDTIERWELIRSALQAV